MNPDYHKICKDFKTGNDLMEAIVSNRAIVFYYLSQLIMLNSDDYKNLVLKEGKQTADRLLTDTLIVFHRLVKNNKIELLIQDKLIMTSKENMDLFIFLSTLLRLLIETSSANPAYLLNLEFEKKLISGEGFYKINDLKTSIINSLYSFGCKDMEDREEIFDESLLLFWKKLKEGEVGVYFPGNIQKLENCRVFNRKYYQSSKLSTYLTGISRNIFLNRTRTTEYQVFRNNNSELTEVDGVEEINTGSDSPALFLFLFYRNMVEDRKLRTVISMLQYDCNLEDKDVQQLIGINNTRIHSSRLRAHFSEWYFRNINRIPEILDTANDYLAKRELKKEKLNEKIRTIEKYLHDDIKLPDLNVFEEEFHSITEFEKYCRIFKYVIYFSATGKPSALAGLPDEKPMRTMLEVFKTGLSSLSQYQSILLLLYYGSDEPGEIIIHLLNELKIELLQQDPQTKSAGELTRQLQLNAPATENELITELYKTNGGLFNHLSTGKNFIKMIYENEPA